MVSAFQELTTQMKGQEQPHGDDLSEWQGSLSGVDVQREDREPHGVDRCEGDGPRGPQAGRTQDTPAGFLAPHKGRLAGKPTGFKTSKQQLGPGPCPPPTPHPELKL